MKSRQWVASSQCCWRVIMWAIPSSGFWRCGRCWLLRIFPPNFSIGEEIGGKTCSVPGKDFFHTIRWFASGFFFVFFFPSEEWTIFANEEEIKPCQFLPLWGGGIVKTQILMSLLFEGELGAFFCSLSVSKGIRKKSIGSWGYSLAFFVVVVESFKLITWRSSLSRTLHNWLDRLRQCLLLWSFRRPLRR